MPANNMKKGKFVRALSKFTLDEVPGATYDCAANKIIRTFLDNLGSWHVKTTNQKNVETVVKRVSSFADDRGTGHASCTSQRIGAQPSWSSWEGIRQIQQSRGACAANRL
jgi:hypothetical protein